MLEDRMSGAAVRNRVALRTLSLSATLLVCGLRGAHAGNPPQGEFEDFGSPAQQPVAAGTMEVCFALDAAGAQDPAQADLLARCGDVLATAVNLGFSVPGPANGTPFLDVSDPDAFQQFAAALQQLGTEETAAPGTSAAETLDGRALLGRLAAVRAGTTGVAVAGLHFEIEGQHVPAETLLASLGPPASSGSRSAALHANQAPADPADAPLAASERWGVFVNGSMGFGEQDSTAREDGFDFSVPGLMVGVDRRVGDDLVLGGALAYAALDADYDTTPVVSGGDLKSDQLSFSAYGTYYRERFNFDGVATYGRHDYEMNRRIVYPTVATSASAETEGSQLELTAAAGYTGQRGTLQYHPFLRVSWLSADVDDYVESGAGGLNLAVEDQEIDSLVSVPGVQLSWTLSSKRGVFVPHVRGEWYHEFDNDSRLIAASYAADPFDITWGVPTDDPDENYFAAGAGVACVGRGGRQGFLDLETLIGLDDVTSYVATAGFRMAF